MSSYSQPATRRSSSSSTSYTYGIPGSQVTISLNKDGNHSLTLSRGPNPNSKPFCKVCYDAGLPVADYTDHYVKDQPGPGGKVVCPTLLAQKCFKCGVAGHTSSYCPEEARRERERKERERESKRAGAYVNGWKVVGGGGDVSSSKPRVEAAPAPVAVAALPAVARNSFGLLAVDDDSSSSGNESDSVQPQPQPQPEKQQQQQQEKEQQPAKPLTWAQRAAAAATKAPTTSTTGSGSGSSSGSSSSNGISMTTGFRVPHVVDTRFQLHALCQNISVTQRGSSAKKAAAANHRGNAAAVAREGSLKRKQESVTIPA